MSREAAAGDLVGVALLGGGGAAVLMSVADGVPLPIWVVALAWVGLFMAVRIVCRLIGEAGRARRRVPDGFTSRYARGEWSE